MHKHISKPKCPKHTNVGPLLEVDRSTKCTPFWREAHLPSQTVQDTPGSDDFWKLRCRKSARRCSAKHMSKSKVQSTEGDGALFDVQVSFRLAGAGDCASCQSAQTWGFCRSFYITLRYTTLDYTNYITPNLLHCTTLTTLRSIALHYTTLHYTAECGILAKTTAPTATTLYSIRLQYTNYITRHSTPLHCTPRHSTPLHYTALQLHLQLQLRDFTLHYRRLHYTTLHHPTLHYTTLITPPQTTATAQH